jgi:hypothetical protein
MYGISTPKCTYRRNFARGSFYKTENGAHVGDLFMSLIHTCHLHGVNAFDYLTEPAEARGRVGCPPAGMDAVELPGPAVNRLTSKSAEVAPIA